MIQRTGYPNSSRSHFQGTDIWSTADPASPQGTGWLGRYLDQLPPPVDPLTAWSTQRETPRTLLARTVGVPSITNVAGYAFASPNGGTDAHVRARDRDPDLVARAGRPAASGVRQRAPRRRRSPRSTASRRSAPTCPSRDLSEQRFRAGAADDRRRDGARASARTSSGCRPAATTRTPAQNPNAANGAYTSLMGTLNDGLFAFYNDLQNQGLLNDTLILQFSEFGRRITENGSQRHRPRRRRPDDGDRRAVRGGIYGTAAEPPRRQRQPDAREQQRRRPLRDRLPRRLRAGHRFLARRGTRVDPGRGFRAGARRSSESVSECARTPNC